jgi:hypothetical protein
MPTLLPPAVADPARTTTLADYVRAVAPHVPPGLIDPTSLAAIATVAAALPAAISNHYGFECRLGIPDTSADFLLTTNVATGGGEILAGRHPGIPAPRILHADPGWQRARAFCAAWGDPASPLHDAADHVCFEFDVSDPASRGRIPNLFFAPQAPNWVGTDEVSDDQRTVEFGIDLLAGGSLAPETATVLRTIFATLPPQTWVFQVGVMGARTPAPMRLQFSRLSPADFVAFLERMRWCGSVPALAAALDELAPLTDDITYAVDVHGGLGPKIGLECYLDHDAPPARWMALLDHLVAAGLCLPAKRDALLAWPGVSQEQTAPAIWPANLAQATRLLGGRSVPVLSRYLHHVKPVFLDGRIIETKAYPGVALHWATRAR